MTMSRLADETFRPAPSGGLPLCVDLDGTLLHIDTLQESTFAAAFADWRVLFRLPGWLAEGKAKLKAELAKRWRFDPATLPYNADLLQYIRAQHEAGRHLVLCTAADRSIAERVAEYLDLFDEVIASDGQTNLRGGLKAEALRRRFGEGGFVYAGNDASDFPIWDSASEAVVVNARRSVLRAARSRYHIAATFRRSGFVYPRSGARHTAVPVGQESAVLRPVDRGRRLQRPRMAQRAGHRGGVLLCRS